MPVAWRGCGEEVQVPLTFNLTRKIAGTLAAITVAGSLCKELDTSVLSAMVSCRNARWCGSLLVNRRYTDSDLCEDCERLPSLEIQNNRQGKRYTKLHPLIKHSRRVVDSHDRVKKRFVSMFQLLSDANYVSSSGSFPAYDFGMLVRISCCPC